MGINQTYIHHQNSVKSLNLQRVKNRCNSELHSAIQRYITYKYIYTQREKKKKQTENKPWGALMVFSQKLTG